MPSTVLVTEPEYRRAEAVFRATTELTCLAAPADEAGLVEMIPTSGARHVVLGPKIYHRDELYARLPKGGVVARFGVGWDGVDLQKATRAGLLCTNTPDVLTQSVAELAMGLIMAAARRVPALDRALRDGAWVPSTGIELAGKTLAIIGFGNIGASLARIASKGLGMRVIGCRRNVPASAAAGADGYDVLTSDFAAAVRDADFVSLHIPAIPDNVHYINEQRLAALREHAWLINTARGSVVDEAALYRAIAEHRIGGAALDVFEREPYVPVDPEHDLRRLDNVLLVPHVGSNTADANRRMAERALRNIVLGEARAFGGMDLLNPEVCALNLEAQA